MSSRADRLARVVLSRAAEPGDPRTASLVRQLGAEAALAHLRAEDASGQGELVTRLREVEPERELEQAARLGIRFLVPGDEEWPRQLDDLTSHVESQGLGGPPVGLWVKGPLRLDGLARSVAVVGSRSATGYGTAVAHDLAGVVARTGRAVVSGGAVGIDRAAHRGALAAAGTTVVVLACGVDRPYPMVNKGLIDHVALTGAVVSEVPPGSMPTRVRFLVRNRLIAALACGTVLVEAAIRSGALNTARWADQMSRHVMGVPGPVTSAPSQGVHELIRSGGATLVTDGHQVLELVGHLGEHLLASPRGPERPDDRLSIRQRQLLDATPVLRPAPVHSIASAAGMASRHVASALETLAARGMVVEGPVGSWRRSLPGEEGPRVLRSGP